MSVSVRGRVPRRADGKFTDSEANNIEQRLLALERQAAGGAPQFLSPSVPTFGGGIVVAPGGGAGSGGGSGSGSGGTTTINNTTVEESFARTFLLMGA